MRTFVLLLLGVLSLARNGLAGEDLAKLEAPAGAERKFFFNYTVNVKEVPAGAKKFELWIPVPQDTAHQAITNLKFDAPAQPEIGVDPATGNKIAYWKLEGDAVKPFSVKLTFDCTRKEIAAKLDGARDLNAEEQTALAEMLKANKLVLVGDEVKDLAAKATGEAKSTQEIAKATYEYVYANMKYDKPADKKGWGQGSTKWAVEQCYGNCTDFHALFMSIARTKGVPVKFEMGFPVAADKQEAPVGGYHCWAKFYLGGVGWVPVDASDAWKAKKKDEYFGKLPNDRVQFTTGRDVNLVPKQAGEPLNYFIYPYAEADGKKVDAGIERLFAFQNK